MDAFSERQIERIVLCKGSQLGGTEAIYNMLGYAIDQDPAPALLVMPTLDLAREISASRIQPMINHSPSLARKKPADADEFSLQSMRFPGMPITVSGANSPSSLASKPCRYVFLDEVNKFPAFSGKEADPISLAEERQKTFWNRKTVILSTPTDETGAVTSELSRCDEIRDCWVPCPICGVIQTLKMAQIKWPDDMPKDDHYPIRVRDSARYECEGCGQAIDDLQRVAMLSGCRWIPRAKSQDARSVGFVISSLYSPWLRWGDIAEKFVRSKDYPDKLMNFVNSWLAEPWVSRVVSSSDDEIMKARTDLARGELPPEAVAITCGIDTQAVGFWYRVRAWAKDLTSWGLDEGFLPGWQELEELLFQTRFKTSDGKKELGIWRALIDSGGTRSGEQTISRTEEIYGWLRANMRRGVRIWACKGASRQLQGLVHVGPVLDKTPSGKSLSGWGIQVVSIDTDAAKDILHARLEHAAKNEPGGAYLHRETDPIYSKHIMAEEKRKSRSGEIEWVRIKKENHLLDAEVYCLACVDPGLFGGLRPYQDAPARQVQAPPPPQQNQQHKPIGNPFLAGRQNPFARR